jgi:signal transduction histidine kinase/FixJ family two-component response regulator
MLKNISLRHLIPLLFFSGSLLLVVFFYLIGLPSAQQQASDLSKRETHSLILTQQSRIIELLIENEPTKVNKEIYFASTDPTVKRVLIVDTDKTILFANRSRIIGTSLTSLSISLDNILIPFPESGVTDIIVTQQAGSDTLLNAFAALRFRRGEKDYNYTLILVRDYGQLSAAISAVAAVPSELLATVMLIFSILVVLLLRQHLDNRLTPLLKAANDLANGDAGARANLKGADEFSDIGRSFDLMANRMESHHHELKVAKENAEKANEAKNNFLGVMSHEIQTPLSGLIGFIDLLGDTKLDEEARLYVRSAQSASRTLSGLITDLLEASRLESGKIRASTEVFCLNVLLQEVTDSILPRSLQKGLSFKILSNENEPIWLESDPRIFRQILINLVGNALQFTEKGTVSISVSVTSTGGPHVALSISVNDTGIGIKSSEISYIFNRFYKSSVPKAQASPGSGVGLAICKELATILGGNITAESVLGKGSTFTLDLEVISADPPNDFNYSVLTQREQKPQNILLVEGSEITRTLIRSILSKWGHRVTPCKSSEDAIRKMRDRLIYPKKDPITLIVLDMEMPGLSGDKTMSEIRALSRGFARLPFVATSTKTDPAQEGEYRAAGFDGFIAKPVDRNKMADEIFRLTRRISSRPMPGHTASVRIIS